MHSLLSFLSLISYTYAQSAATTTTTTAAAQYNAVPYLVHSSPSSSSISPPQYIIPCKVSDSINVCPSGLHCTPTELPRSSGLQGGVCYNWTPPPVTSTPSYSSTPPQYTIPCKMSDSINICPSGLACTPTEYPKSSGLQGGVCYNWTPPPPTSTPTVTPSTFYSSISSSPPQYTIPCKVSDSINVCPSGLACTPTEYPQSTRLQGGVCYTTAGGGPNSACIVGSPSTTCSGSYSCTAYTNTCTSSGCLGTCIGYSTSYHPSSSSALPSSKRCTSDWECPPRKRCVKSYGSRLGYCS